MSEITYKGHTTTFKISNFFDFFLPKKTPPFFRRKYFFKGDHDVDVLTVKFTLGSFFDKFKMPRLHF